MKLLLLVIIGYLAVSTQGAGGLAQRAQTNAEAEGVVSQSETEDAGKEGVVEESVDSDPETTSPDEDLANKEADLAITTETQETGHEKKTSSVSSSSSLSDDGGSFEEEALSISSNAGPKPLLTQSTSKWNVSVVDMMPFPLNIFWRTVGKDVLKSLDVESMCDAVELLDLKQYQKLLENDNFVGFQEKIANDEFISLTAEALKESTMNYINKMTVALTDSVRNDGLGALQNNFKQFFGNLPLRLGIPIDGSIYAHKTSKLAVEPIATNEVQKEAMIKLQTNLNKLLEVLSSVKAQNSIAASTKSELSGYDKGSAA